MKLYEQFFQEVKRPAMSYIDRQDKINRETGRLSFQVSKDRQDALNKRMEYHREKYKYYKQKILDKYSTKVKTQARK